jgi:hypothetical protein
MNLYGYVANDPVNQGDPIGLEFHSFDVLPDQYGGVPMWYGDSASEDAGIFLHNVGAAAYNILKFLTWENPCFLYGSPPVPGRALPAVLYQKLSASGGHLKFGVTKSPARRYLAKELAGGRLKVLAEGPRKDMLGLERELHETLPIGPEEGQKFYIQHQVSQGLRAPPY